MITQRLEAQKHDIRTLKNELYAIKEGKGFMTFIAGLVKQEVTNMLEKASIKKFDIVLQGQK